MQHQLPSLHANLSFDDMALFLRIAELGTLSAVARERDVPTSQVSRSLAKVETAYGLKLIERSTHGLSLTSEGDVFLGYCRQVLGALGELAGELDVKTQTVAGTVRMSVSPVVAQYLIVPKLSALLARHPDLRIDLSVDDRMSDLVRDGIDLAIRTGTPASESVVAKRIATHQRGLFAAPSYLAQFGTPRTPEELQRHRLIANGAVNALNHWRFLVGGKLQEMAVVGAHRADSTATLMNMALHGLGITRLNAAVAQTLIEQGKLVEVLADFRDSTPLPVFAVFLPNRQRLPKIRACLDFWTEAFA
jgi:DNA-binding transcriptional LysR family regulator